MPNLVIDDFSCIKHAEFNLAPVNVIIGPQGSGKSVTTKLLYFFADVLSNFNQAAERGDTLEQYKHHIEKQFCIWFPPGAWGSGRFRIVYTAGAFDFRVLRRYSKGKLSENVSVRFSDWFTETYLDARQQFAVNQEGAEQDLETNPHVTATIDRLLKTREIIDLRIGRVLKDEYLAQQTFIPAGRAFFTTIGRMVAGFEQAGSLDPVTIKFARLFANLRDRNARRLVSSRVQRLGSDYLNKRSRFMSELFGGELKYENDTEYVKALDGRKIPFSSLSSGQQELLPMWSLIDYFNELDMMRGPPRPTNLRRWRRELIYIEEPEAHLFPSAQSLLMEFLIGSVASERFEDTQRSLILTTHSPYIMAKLNVFLKAGQLSRRKKRNQDINEIVPRECWLNESQLAAYAIEDGKMRNLLDEEGLIDGTYLDQISEEISQEFSSLLSIESEISSL